MYWLHQNTFQHGNVPTWCTDFLTHTQQLHALVCNMSQETAEPEMNQRSRWDILMEGVIGRKSCTHCRVFNRRCNVWHVIKLVHGHARTYLPQCNHIQVHASHIRSISLASPRQMLFLLMHHSYVQNLPAVVLILSMTILTLLFKAYAHTGRPHTQL